MNIREALGLPPKKKIHYGFVALGDIAQEAMLPGVEHTGNSTIAALVTGDPVKAGRLAERHGVAHTHSYKQLPEAVTSGHVEALSIATPTRTAAPSLPPGRGAGEIFVSGGSTPPGWPRHAASRSSMRRSRQRPS